MEQKQPAGTDAQGEVSEDLEALEREHGGGEERDARGTEAAAQG